MKKLLTIIFALCLSTAALAEPRFIPDPDKTPGVADKTVTVEKLCLAGYTGSVRNVSKATKNKVFAEYGVDPTQDRYEVDHLISLEIGGSNDIGNLWPESYTTLPFNAHKKDKLENKLHRMICDGLITIEEAQREMVNDWRKAYCRYYSDLPEACKSLK